MRKIKRALISLSNKDNLKKLISVLSKYKIELISSGGTFNKIKKCPPSRIKEERIRIPDARKFGILVGIYFKHRIHTI